MATSGTISSNKKDIDFSVNGGYIRQRHWLEFRWTSSVVSPGITRVSWQLYGFKEKIYGSSYIDLISTSLNLVLSANGTTKTLYTANYFDSTGTFNYVGGLVHQNAKGSFDITHNASTGAGSFSISFNNLVIRDNSTYWEFNSNTGTGTLDKNYSYSACSAPTSISVSASIIKPSDSITVSWSGASAGTANPITGYRLYYNYGSAPTTSSSSVSTSSTSYTFTAGAPDLSSHRGQRLYFRVVTVGSVSGYDSSISTASSNTLINSLPNAPSRVSEIKDVYESSKANSSINIQINAGSDPQGTATSVYYSTSAGGTYSIYSGSLKMPSQGNSQSYYFKTWDGLEFSSNYTSVILNINSKPTVELTLTPKATLSSKNKPSDTSYVVGFELESRNGANGQNNNTYTYTLEYGNTSSLGSTQTINGNGANITINDIRTYITPSLQAQYYKVSVVRNDGVENSAPASCSDIYCITPKPNMFIYNNSGLESDIGPQTNEKYYFSNGIYVKYDFDEGYNGAQLSCKDPVVSIYASANNFNNDYKAVTFNLINIGSYGTAYEFSAYLTYNNANVNGCSLEKTYIRISEFKLSNFKFTYNGGTYKPYNLTKETTLGFSWGVQDQEYEKYGLAENAPYKFIFNNGDNQQEYSTTRNEINKNIETATQYYTFDNETLFNSIINKLNLPQSGEQSIYTKLVITNLFGENLTSEEISIQVSLQYDITDNDVILLFPEDEQGNPILLKQDMSLDIIYQFKTYNDPNLVKIGYKTNYIDWKDITEAINIIVLSTDIDEEGYLDGKKEYQATISLIIPEISYPDVIYNFRLTVNGITQICSTNYNTIWHTIGSVKLLNAISYKEIETEGGINKKLTFSINPSSWGLIPSDNTEISQVYFEYSKPNGESGEFNIEPTNFEDTFTKESLGNDSDPITITFDPPGLDFTALNARLVFVIKENTAPTTTYTTYTNTVIIYNTAPTVSYRKNHMGINIKPTSSDGIITIQTYQDYKKIYLQSTSTTYIIDVESGSIDGFIISGGSWD